MAESAILTARAVKFGDRFPCDVGILFDDHLADAVAVIYGEVVLTQIDEDYAYLSAIVGIDRAGRVGD